MRISKLLVVVAAGLTFGLGGCGPIDPAPADEPAAVSESAAGQEGSEENVTAMATCPLRWTCDYWNYYSTKSACEAACGVGSCVRDFDCNGTCICP